MGCGDLQVDLDIGYWLCTTEEDVSLSGRIEGQRGILNVAIQQTTFTPVTDTRPARPFYIDITGLGGFEEAAKLRLPAEMEVAFYKGDHGPGTVVLFGEVGHLRASDERQAAKGLKPDLAFGDTDGCQKGEGVLQIGGRTADVALGCRRNA